MLVLKSIVNAALRGMALPYWVDRRDMEQEAALAALVAMSKVDTGKDERQQARFCIQFARWTLIKKIAAERRATRGSRRVNENHQVKQSRMVHGLEDGPRLLDGDAESFTIDERTPEDDAIAADQYRAICEAVDAAVSEMTPGERRVVEARLREEPGGRAGGACHASRARKRIAAALRPLGIPDSLSGRLLDVERKRASARS